MATRKEEREALRRHREKGEAEQARKERRRLRIFYALMALIALPVVAGLVVVVGQIGGGSSDAAYLNPKTGQTTGAPPDGREGVSPPPIKDKDLKAAAAKADCELRLDLKDEGATHIPDGAPTPTYGTNPPTSGNHYAEPQGDGAYGEDPSILNSLHSLEHSRVAIQYDPDLPEAEQLTLKGVFDESPGGMLFFPNSKMPYEVAAAAWRNLVGCRSYEGAKTLDVIRAFRDQFRGRGPEAVPFDPGKP